MARKAAGGEWLFPSFNHTGPNKHNQQLVEAFNGRLVKANPDKGTEAHYVGLMRGVCKIADESLSLHSTRHTFIDACRRSGRSPDTEMRLVGHGKGTVHAWYGNDVGMAMMRDAINAVDPLA